MLQKLDLEVWEASKTKTGEVKYSKPFRRTIHEYNHGIICRCCGNTEIITSFSAKTPKYCSQSCRDVVKRKQALKHYHSSKKN